MEWLRRGWRVLVSLLGNNHGVTLQTLTPTEADAIVPELWDSAMNYIADTTAIGNRLSGPDGSDAAIIERTDLTKVPGDTIRFPMLGRLLATPRSGQTELEGQEEDVPVGSFNVSVTYYRHATALDKITQKISQLKPSDINRLVADWLARTLDDDWLTQVLNSETVTNVTFYTGGKTSRATIQAGDVMTSRELDGLAFAAMRRGVTAFRQTRFGELPWSIHGALLSDVDYYLLRGDTEYQQDVRFAAVRGDKNPALSGVIDMYKGLLLYPVVAVNPGDGYLGSYLRPEARLAAALTSAATTMTVGPTTAVTNVNYGKYLPSTGTIRIGAEDMTLSANSSNTLTVTARGVNNTAAAAHAAGDFITLRNLGKVLLFGRHAVLRGWAMKPSMDKAAVINITQKRSYGFEMGFGVDYLYGIKAVLANGDSQPRNYAILETSSVNPKNVG